MSDQVKRVEARNFFAQAYEYQMKGALEEAVEAYRRSIELEPSAEAHTFLGWTYSFMGRYEEAISECKHAIELDPDFGNPWNDIGAYLIETGKEEEAIGYLEQATRAKRYDSRCFPYYNLGRIFAKKGMLHRATEEFRHALEEKPDYALAQEALENLEQQLN